MQDLKFPPTSISSRNVTSPLGQGIASSSNGFGDVLKMNEVDALMQKAPQYQRWRQIRQNNDGKTAKIADMILEHHSLSQKAQQGNAIDWQYYDNLAKGLTQYGFELPPPLPVDKNVSTQSIEIAENFPQLSPVVEVKQVLNSENGSKLNEDNLLILEMKLDKFLLQSGLIGYGNNENSLLPLGELTKALDLAIDVDIEAGIASGWFISEGRSFLLDVDKKLLEIEGKKRTINPGDVELGTDDIYVDSKALANWFPADFRVNLSELSVQVDAREKFPVQERLDREELRERLERHTTLGKATLPLLESEYRFFSTPVIDVSSSNYFKSNDATSKLRSINSIRAVGDLAFMSSDLFISGDDQDPLENVTWKLERNDPQANLFGFIGATSFSIGDIATAKIPFVQTGVERGISINNKDLVLESEFDSTRFEGNMPPGWDLEVYRNDRLVAATNVDSAGHYEIEDIAVYFGENRFKIIAFGPQGQQKVEEKLITVGSEMLQSGRSRYDVSFSDRDRMTLEFDEDDRGGVIPGDSRFVGKYEYGLTNKSTVSGGVASVELDGLRHNYYNVGLHGSFSGAIAKGDIVKSSEGGMAVQLLAQSSVGPLLVRAKQDFLDNFVEPNNFRETDKVKTRTNLSVSGTPLKLDPLPSMPYSMSLQYTNRENSTETEFSGRISSMINGTYISNEVTYRDDTGVLEPSQMDGSAYLSRRFGPLSLRGSAHYELQPDYDMKSYDINGSLAISPKLNTQMTLSHTLGSDGETQGSVSLNWDTGKILVSPKLSYDSEHNLSAFLNLNFSLGKNSRTNDIEFSSQRLTNSGSVSARVYHDKDNNRVFDGEDEAVVGAEVKAVQSLRKGETDQNGVALLLNLPNFKRTDLAINHDSLEDPFWLPSEEGVSIIPRPGEVQRLDFPVVTTGEVDGTVFVREKDGSMTPLRNSEIVLYDGVGKEVQRIKSEYDGFYLFEKVLPGEYSVRIDPKLGRYGGALARSVAQVNIGTDGTVVNGLDFVVQGSEIIAATEQVVSKPQFAKGTPKVDNRGNLFVRKVDGRREKVQTSDDERPRIRMVTPGITSFKAYRDTGQTEGETSKLVSPLRLPEGFQQLKTVTISTDSQVDSLPKVIKAKSYKERLKGNSSEILLTSSGLPDPSRSRAEQKTEDASGIRRTNLVSKSITSPRQHVLTEKIDRPRINLVSRTSIESKNNSVIREEPVVYKEEPATGFGLQLASFSVLDNAITTLDELQKSLKNILPSHSLTIVPIDLGPKKGMRFRVVAAGLGSRSQVEKLSRALKKENYDSIPVKSAGGSKYQVHLASYQDAKSAAMGLQKIRQEHSDLFLDQDLAIKRVELGAGKGIWYRVVAGRIAGIEEAEKLSGQLSGRMQYNKILSN